MLKGFISFAETAVANGAEVIESVQETIAVPAGTEAAEATAEAAKAPPSAWEGLASFLPFIILFVAMFYLMFRGQKKEQKRRAEMVSSIHVGSKVLTIGGFIGTISAVSDESFEIEIAKNVKVEIAKTGIASVFGDKTEGAAGK